MLKYKRITTSTLTNGAETLDDMLSGFAGKNRRIVSIATAPLALLYLRVYRDAEQILDCASIHLTTAAPWLIMDLPLADGQQCKVGFYNNGGSTNAKQVTVGYTED